MKQIILILLVFTIGCQEIPKQKQPVKQKEPETFVKVTSPRQLNGVWFIEDWALDNNRMITFTISNTDPNDSFFMLNLEQTAIYLTYNDDGENFNITGTAKKKEVFRGTVRINKKQDKLEINKTSDLYGDREKAIWVRRQVIDKN